jgi:hypothetical protein
MPYRSAADLIGELEAMLCRAEDMLQELRGRFGLDAATAPDPNSTDTAPDPATTGATHESF